MLQGIMVLAGIGIPVLAALNAALGRHVGSPILAGVIGLTVATLVAVVVALATRQTGVGLLTAPRPVYLAGGLMAFYLLSITWIAPIIGVGNAVFFVLLGQLISSAIIDHYGLFGARISPISPMRMLGIALMMAGIYCTQRL